MIVDKNQIFNLMDTNGRRSDVLNAFKVYLEILEELKQEYPTEAWNTYPSSIAQFVFYEKALEKSKEVFKTHKNYDNFINALGTQYKEFLDKDANWIDDNLQSFEKVLDEAIEKRARHYTSNLVKIGFTDSTRNITEVGYSYLKNNINRDRIEEFLPLDNINITLLRQLAKLKIFSDLDENGKRSYYSPFLMALVVLLENETLDKNDFEVIVQGLSPYSSKEIKNMICDESINIDNLKSLIREKTVDIPQEIKEQTKIEEETFNQYFKSSKNNDTTLPVYYNFYIAINNFRENKTVENYNALITCIDNNSSLINKAFGYGSNVFNAGNKGKRYSLEIFLEKNKKHHLLTAEDFSSEIYKTFVNSKWIDGIKEYSDTTIRLLSATGLFKFKTLPELAYKDILKLIFDSEHIKKEIFGEMNDDEFLNYESNKDSFFVKSTSISEIFKYSDEDIAVIIENMQNLLNVKSVGDVKFVLENQKHNEFIQHICDKYSKQTIIDLLPLFSDRKNDMAIKNQVNDSATVPTIYEYIIGIAWYYISDKNFDLFNSLNLTLNADFEPVLHAGGGDGDIVIDYENITIMLEVTLMNKQAQKRGEWEPVLRHSLNLKASREPKETITFFVADELDYNTINIWRAVSAVSLESTNTHHMVNGVIIMPFTNSNILYFLNKNIKHTKIIQAVKESFSKIPQITNAEWHNDIMNSLTI